MAPVHHDHDAHAGQKATHHKATLPLSEHATELASAPEASQLLQAEHAPPNITPAALMNVQRIQGNRATTHLIARMIQRQKTRVRPARPTQISATRVAVKKTDGPYGWMAKYAVRFTADECHLHIKVKLVPAGKISQAEIQRVKAQTKIDFLRLFDNQFKLTDRQTQKVFSLRVNLHFVSSDEHLAVTLHPGDGRSNLKNWYVAAAGTRCAHELGHQMGLKDEYIDARVPNRSDAKAPGVFKDNSIMGGFRSEGMTKARAKLRHGRVIAQDIGAKTGHTFTTSMK